MKIGIQTWGSDGDILPFAALAGGLSAAGHEVELVLTSVDGKDYRQLGKDLNFGLRQVGNVAHDRAAYLEVASLAGYTKNPFKQLDIILERLFEPFTDEMYSDSERLCEENEILIGHFIHHPLRAAAEKSERPYVSVTLNHGTVATGFRPPTGMPNLGRTMNALLWKMVMTALNKYMVPPINRLRIREGLTPIRSCRESWESDLLNLVAVSRIFCEGYPDWERYHRVCGFLNMPHRAEEYVIPKDLGEFLASGPPPLYMTFGSMVSKLHERHYITATIRLMINAARIARRRAIIQSSWDEVTGMEESPDIYRITKAPHQVIFPHCSAVIHHGGAGTSQSSIRAGCPSVVVAHITDQFFWGHELSKLGIAPRPLKRTSVTAEALARAIRSVLDSPSKKVRAEQLGKRLRRENGVGRAVELIGEIPTRG